MSFRSQWWAAAAVVLASTGSAFAQGTYVSGSVFGDIVRTTHVEYPGAIEPADNGEAIGFALRLGTPLGSVWGVEVEYAHPGEIENETTPFALPLASPALTFTNLGNLPGVSTVFPDSIAPTILPYSVRTAARHTTLSTALWFQQQLSGRVALVYLGGMAFYRSELEFEYQFTFPRLIPAIPSTLVALPPFQSESVAYGIRPLAGIESRVGLTDRTHLVAGVRLQASSGIWLVRPAIGLGWMF